MKARSLTHLFGIILLLTAFTSSSQSRKTSLRSSAEEVTETSEPSRDESSPYSRNSKENFTVKIPVSLSANRQNIKLARSEELGKGTPQDGDEMVDIKTEFKSNGDIKLKFSSHGKTHSLELAESRIKLADIAVKLVGSSEEYTQQVLEEVKTIKMMTDIKSGATIAFKMQDGNSKPLIQRGLFKLGKHQFDMTHDTLSNRTKVTRKPADDKFEPRNIENLIPKDKIREKRDIPVSISPVYATVELVIIVDYAIWSERSSGDVVAAGQTSHTVDVLVYYAYMTAIMSRYYNSMKNSDVRVAVDLAGVVIIKSSLDLSNLVEDYESFGKVDSSSTLQRLANWLDSSGSNVPPYDHVMLFTGYDSYDSTSGSTSTTGSSYPGRICDSSYSSSVIESQGLLTLDARSASSILAISLGADEDGYSGSSGCSDENYIAGSVTSDEDTSDNRYLFSCCSQRSFYATIKASGSCLMTYSADRNYHSSIDDNVEDYLPGEMLTADDQCYLREGTSACNFLVNTDICSVLWCVSSEDSSRCLFYGAGAADGTACGFWSLSRCYQGKCVYSSQTHTNDDQDCYVGECYSNEKKCDYGVNTVLPQMFRCYHDSVACDGTSDCSDGSDEANCYCPYGYSKCITGARESPYPSSVSKICVYDSYLCDGDKDCKDGSDEGVHYCDVTSTTTTTSTAANNLWWEEDRSTTPEMRGECYICENSYECVSTEAECNTYCPYDDKCVERFQWLDNAGSSLTSSNLLFMSFVLFALFYK